MRSATTSGRVRSAAWSVFFETDLEFLEGQPQVGDGGREMEIPFEVFERGSRFGRDWISNPLPFAFGERCPLVGAGPGFERRARAMQRLDGSDPGRADAEHLGDVRGGHPLVGEGDDAMAKLDGQRFHGRHLSQCADENSRLHESAQE